MHFSTPHHKHHFYFKNKEKEYNNIDVMLKEEWIEKGFIDEPVSDSIDLKTLSPAPSAKSPTFHMPGAVNVKVTNVYTKNNSSWGSYTYKMTLNDGTEVVSHSSNTEKQYSFSWTGEMNPNRTVFTCSYNYIAAGNDVTVNSVIVEYN